MIATIALGGDGLNALLRHAVAAVLNAVHPYVADPLTAAQVIALVNDAIASGNNATIKHLANRLARYNEVGSDLDANGRPGRGVSMAPVAKLALHQRAPPGVPSRRRGHAVPVKGGDSLVTESKASSESPARASPHDDARTRRVSTTPTDATSRRRSRALS